MFWKALDHLHQWQREHLPECESPQGNDVLMWLLKCEGTPRPLKDLYRSSRFSEPTLRSTLRAFVDRGLIELEVNDNDMRNRFARVTPKFVQTISAYRQRFGEIAVLLDLPDATANLPPDPDPPGPPRTRN